MDQFSGLTYPVWVLSTLTLGKRGKERRCQTLIGRWTLGATSGSGDTPRTGTHATRLRALSDSLPHACLAAGKKPPGLACMWPHGAKGRTLCHDGGVRGYAPCLARGIFQKGPSSGWALNRSPWMGIVDIKARTTEPSDKISLSWGAGSLHHSFGGKPSRAPIRNSRRQSTQKAGKGAKPVVYKTDPLKP